MSLFTQDMTDRKESEKEFINKFPKLLRVQQDCLIYQYTVIAFLFSPEVGDTDEHLINMTRCENIKHNI